MIYGCGIFNKLCVLVSRHVEETVFMVTKHVVLKYGNTITFSSNGTSHINSIKFAALINYFEFINRIWSRQRQYLHILIAPRIGAL